MDAIRKKMHSLKVETDTFKAQADAWEAQAAEANKAADKNDLIVRQGVGERCQIDFRL